jgi:hypothetical protein
LPTTAETNGARRFVEMVAMVMTVNAVKHFDAHA